MTIPLVVLCVVAGLALACVLYSRISLHESTKKISGGSSAPIALVAVVAAGVVAVYVDLAPFGFFEDKFVPGAAGPAIAEAPKSNWRKPDAAAKSPQDAAGWARLAHAYVAQRRFDKASAAYANAIAMRPEDPQLLADYADALAVARGRRLEGEPEQLIRRALKADPANLKALALAGNAAFERKDYETAVSHWQRLLDLVKPESGVANSARAGIAEARSRLAAANGSAVADSGPQAPRIAASTSSKANAAGTNSVSASGRIEIAAPLLGKLTPTATLFVLARPVEGGHMPYAVVRRRLGDLPAEFSFEGGLTVPFLPEGVDRFVVVAHISRSGLAIPRSGDLEGASTPVRNGERGVVVVIDREIP